MSNAAKNEVLSSFRETINNSLAEMDHRKLKHLFHYLSDYQGTLSAFELMEARSCSELKHIFCHSHVNNDVITLTLI